MSCSLLPRRLFARALLLLPLLTLLLPPMLAHAAAHPPRLQSRSIYVINAVSGRTLYSKNSAHAYPLASLTKLMTAMVVLDSHRPLGNRIQVKPADRDLLKKTGSRLTVSSVLSRRDMLHIALMSSENRAAAALSRYYSGGRPGFLRQMNRKARALGMRHSHFFDPTGLSPRNVASARDVARMARAAWHYPLIRRFSTDKGQVVYPGHGRLVYHSSNGLIHNHHWRIQLQKTGFTDEAGHCMVVRTLIHGKPVLMVIMGGKNRYAHYADALRLKNWLERR
ncbi:serine hydrolase [Nissabacter sp. SGAir0207]|uniref:serine hydrolase n=1 Tax=Nissabacter sp. SGAir0207 TaxID=2126321 RepID=UPI0010CD1224|nr:serine hydrolase [Nissabacter sp. SGAir0207]QCR36070.1 peptidase S11 [Nissabacter sp. SGAir0207]